MYVNSPMALAALTVYRTAIDQKSDELRPEILGGDDPFDPGDLRLVHSVDESIRINNPGSSAGCRASPNHLTPCTSYTARTTPGRLWLGGSATNSAGPR